MIMRNYMLGLLLAGAMAPLQQLNADDVEDVIRTSLARVIPAHQIQDIRPAPMQGFREVRVGMNIFYVSDDGKYVVRGSVIDMDTRSDLTESRLGGIRKEMVDSVATDSMIVFPASKEKHVITVFTDIDCGYCRKLHDQIDAYNASGITVRYLSFPRSGPDSEGYHKAVSVWCAEDRNVAMTKAKSGENTGTKKCDNPVKDHLDLGVQLGVNGTPAIILEDGSLLPGYVPPSKLSKELNGKNKG